MRAAPQREVRGVRRSALPERNHVMELEPTGLAASAMRTFKSATTTVSCPYFAPDSGGDVPPVPLARPGRSWLPSTRELRPLELIDEQREPPVEDCGVIACRNRVAQQVLRLAKLALGVSADRELRRKACDLLFDLTLCLVPGRFKQPVTVLIGQVGPKERKRRQGQCPFLEEPEHDRKPLRRPRGLDSVVGRMLGQVKDLSAIGEKRRAALAEVQFALIELGKKAQEFDGRVSFIGCSAQDRCEEIPIRELRSDRWNGHSCS